MTRHWKRVNDQSLILWNTNRNLYCTEHCYCT